MRDQPQKPPSAGGEGDLSNLRWPEEGLLPVVIQDARTGEVLTVAYADREALARTLSTGETWLYSRSRRQLWHKGETSGNVQRVVEVRTDCDGDALLYRVIPEGPACHTGARSCFFRPLQAASWVDLAELAAIVEGRRTADPETSYTARLLQGPAARRAQKVGEEGVETALAAATGDREGLVREAADLLYHLTVLLAGAGIGWEEVWAELGRRHRRKEGGR